MEIEREHVDSGPAYDRFLRLFADVHPREGATSLILVANIFLILVAFYLIKPVREGWLAVTDIGDLTKLEIKAYSAFAQSLLLLCILPVPPDFPAPLPDHDRNDDHGFHLGCDQRRQHPLRHRSEHPGR
jgi:hypothetical protein